MTVDIAALLERACETPLGPLDVACSPEGNDAWSLTATYTRYAPVTLHAEKDIHTGGLRLDLLLPPEVNCDWRTYTDSRSWITDTTDAGSQGPTLRLWLHGDGLTVNTLLSAIADLARLGPRSEAATPPEPAGLQEAFEPQEAPIVELTAATGETPADTPPLESASIAVPPASTRRPIAWETFATAPVEPGAAQSDTSPDIEPIVDTPSTSNGPAETSPDAIDALPEAAMSSPGSEPVVTSPAGELDALSAVSTPAPVVADPEPPKPAGKDGYCRECGSPHRAEHIYCTSCGATLN